MAKDEWETGSDEPGARTRPGASRWVMFGILGLVVAGLVAVLAFQFDPGPPPKAIEDDPLLVQGRRVYLINCAGCHGDTGKGDGPKAKGLTGPPPGDLTAAHWKHGDRPEQALRTVAKGVPNTTMAAWSPGLKPDDVRAVVAYVYYLAGRTVPKELRAQ